MVQKGGLQGFQVLTPDIPKPTKKARPPRLSFEVTRDELKALREFFEDEARKDNEVGRAAFDFSLDSAGFQRR